MNQSKTFLNRTVNNGKRLQSDKPTSIESLDMRQKIETESEKTMFKTITVNN